MLITEEVEVTLHSRNILHYENLGYEIPRYLNKNKVLTVKKGTKIIVKIKDLIISNNIIECLCDYCLEKGIKTIIRKKYYDYINNRKYIKKDCCKKCTPLKYKDSMNLKYGVNNSFQLKDFREKSKQTCLEKYGVEYASQNNDIKNKAKETNINIRGVPYPLMDEKVKLLRSINNKKRIEENPNWQKDIWDKTHITMFKRYGFYYNSQTLEFKNSYKETCLKKYGVNHPMKNEVIQNKVLKSIIKSRYLKGNAPYSTQQKYLYNLLGGELNYAVDKLWLDIAFLIDKIYIEYDGSGHDLRVKYGDINRKDFELKTRNRYYYLKKYNWKMIRIISLKDRLPSDEVILQMIEYAKEYLNEGHSWIKFDIDNLKIIKSTGNIKVDFGDLRKITKSDLEEVS